MNIHLKFKDHIKQIKNLEMALYIKIKLVDHVEQLKSTKTILYIESKFKYYLYNHPNSISGNLRGHKQELLAIGLDATMNSCILRLT